METCSELKQAENKHVILKQNIKLMVSREKIITFNQEFISYPINISIINTAYFESEIKTTAR